MLAFVSEISLFFYQQCHFQFILLLLLLVLPMKDCNTWVHYLCLAVHTKIHSYTAGTGCAWEEEEEEEEVTKIKVALI